jgi:hypothetical protein
VRATVCGLPVALSLTVMEPVRLPEAVGANVTVITQLAPVVRVAPQVLVCEKFVLATMLVICSTAVPELVRVASSVSLIEPTTSVPKSKLLGDMVAAGDPIIPPPIPPPQPAIAHTQKSARQRCNLIDAPPTKIPMGNRFRNGAEM